MSGKQIYEFGPFRLDPGERLLLRDGKPVALAPKAFDTLVALVENGGHLVKKDDLMKLVWPGTFVEEVNLAQNVSAIRRALDTKGEKYIETVPKVGYRLILNARVLSEPDRAPTQVSSEVPGNTELTQLPGKPTPEKASWVKNLRTKRLAALCLGAVVLLLSILAWRRTVKPATATPIRSLVVLPIINLSGDAGQDYVADGMTDELTTQLAKIGSIRVISRTSAMRFRNSQKPLPQIARELQVDAVVEGSITRSDNRLRLTTQLIDASTDQHLWAESYDRDRRDGFALPSEVAQNIATRIGAPLTVVERARLHRVKPVETAAYEAYFRGRYFWYKRTQVDLRKSLAYFQEATQADPGYAPAYVGLARGYLSLASYSLADARESVLMAKAMSLKALEVDDSLGEAHVPLGEIRAEYDWDLPGAEAEFRQAIALNPNDAVAHQFYAEDVLEPEGRSDEANRELSIAQQLEPSIVIIRVAVGYAHFLARDYDRAIDQERKTLEMEPSFPKAHQILGLAYEGKGMYREAVEEFKTASTLDTNPAYFAGLARSYALNGQPQEAKRVLARLTSVSGHQSANPYQIALIYLALGERDRSLDWLERARKERSWLLIYLKVDPRVDPLRSDPRFNEVLKQIRYLE